LESMRLETTTCAMTISVIADSESMRLETTTCAMTISVIADSEYEVGDDHLRDDYISDR
jgi:hypothetical protein